MARILSFIFFMLCALQVLFDWRATTSVAKPLRFSSIETVWGTFHASSLEVASAFLSPSLGLPLAPILFALALLFRFIAKRKAKQRRW